MSFGQLGADAIPDRLVMDYAPTSRAACKACASIIMQDTVRVGEKVRSPWHDGFDTKWHHVKCAVHLSKCVHDFKGFQRLKWSDQMEIADKISPGLAASTAVTEEGKRVSRLNEMVWEAKERLGKVKKEALKELIQENGVFVSEKAHPTAMLHGIADGLINGLLPPCPWCSGKSLELEGTLLRCYGYVNGATHCTYKSSAPPPSGCPELFGAAAAPVKTEPSLLHKRVGPWVITPVIERALKGWQPPADAPVHRLTGGAPSASASSSSVAAGAAGAAGAEAKATGGKKRASAAASAAAADPPSEDEDGVEDADTMVGMAFACIGTLHPGTAELQEIIEEHGGTFVSGSIGDASIITHLIASAAEARKPPGKQAIKYATAREAGVPIVSADYVLALANERAWFEDDDGDGAEEVEASGGGRGRGGGVGRSGSGGESAAMAIDVDTEEDEPAGAAENLNALKVPELRERCKELGLESTGKKADLLDRLTQHAATAAQPPAPPAKKRKAAGGGAAKAEGAGGSSSGAAPKPSTRVFGAALRQRKHMSTYLLEGGPGPKLPSVATLVAARALRAERDADKAPKPRQKLPTIQPHSELVSVDPEAEMGTASIYVDEWNLAYNTRLNLMDIRTGVNK
jgi:hypothetical protein